jgi:hypothetical protein
MLQHSFALKIRLTKSLTAEVRVLLGAIALTVFRAVLVVVVVAVAVTILEAILSAVKVVSD